MVDDAVTQQDLLLQSADKTISVAIPETTVITDATGDKYYGELLPPTPLDLDTIEYPQADTIQYAFSVGNPDESLHFVDTGNESQPLIFTVQVDSGSFASGQQVLTYYADADTDALSFLSIALVQSDSSGNLFVQMQADHMTDFFIE